MTKKYDIFISYRRKWGALYSRILQLKLQEKGYKVFLDYDELRDGKFDEKIKHGIENSSLFIFLFSKDALVRCKNTNDWVRQEIQYAIKLKKHIIPIIPDNELSVIPDNIPTEIKEVISRNEFSFLDYGKALNSSVESLIKDRIIPHIGKRHPLIKRIIRYVITCISIFFFVLLCIRFFLDYCDYNSCNNYRQFVEYKNKHNGIFHFFKQDAIKTIESYNEIWPSDTLGFSVKIDSAINYSQLLACKSIIDNMIYVKGGTYLMGASDSDKEADDILEKPRLRKEINDFFIGKYEVSVGEWNSILDKPYEEKNSSLPITNVTWYECKVFVERLFELTGISFAIPTEAEWEYAARGGLYSSDFRFSGSNSVDSVAVYAGNSRGCPQIRNCDNMNNKLGLEPNELDLYDMSGNVEEWCADDFFEYEDIKNNSILFKYHNGDPKVIRGGSFESPARDVRVSTRQGKSANQKSSTLGLRIIIRAN